MRLAARALLRRLLVLRWAMAGAVAVLLTHVSTLLGMAVTPGPGVMIDARLGVRPNHRSTGATALCVLLGRVLTGGCSRRGGPRARRSSGRRLRGPGSSGARRRSRSPWRPLRAGRRSLSRSRGISFFVAAQAVAHEALARVT